MENEDGRKGGRRGGGERGRRGGSVSQWGHHRLEQQMREPRAGEEGLDGGEGGERKQGRGSR